MTTAPSRPAAQTPPRRWGQLVWGAAMVALGIAWFVDITTPVSVSYPALAAVLLIGVGIALPLAPAGERGGVFGLGVLLTVVVLATTIVGPGVDPTTIGDGVGDVTVTPSAATPLQARYEHGVGDLSVDLRTATLPAGTTDVDVELAIGTVTVEVPSEVTVEVAGEAGLGEVVLFGEQRGGAGVDMERRVGPSGASRILRLAVSVGIGRVEVIR